MTADAGKPDDRAAYRARIATGGCRVFDCTVQAEEGFSCLVEVPGRSPGGSPLLPQPRPGDAEGGRHYGPSDAV